MIRVQRGSEGCSVAQKGCSVAQIGCCKADASSNLASAPHRGSAHRACSCEDMDGASANDAIRNNECMYRKTKSKYKKEWHKASNPLNLKAV